MREKLATCAGLFLLCTLAAAPARAAEAAAAMINRDLESVGTVILEQTPQGVLLIADLHNLPPGTHGFHVHAVGKCEPPFTSAGGHFNPTGKDHGFKAEAGPHAGDMPNIHVGAGGKIVIEVFNQRISLVDGEANLFGDDGASIVIHAGPDDYKTNPDGGAGPRIACGVIKK
ncbi:MAG: superoxide dismutase family protein [Pseudomonadota bacterium]